MFKKICFVVGAAYGDETFN